MPHVHTVGNQGYTFGSPCRASDLISKRSSKHFLLRVSSSVPIHSSWWPELHSSLNCQSSRIYLAFQLDFAACTWSDFVSIPGSYSDHQSNTSFGWWSATVAPISAHVGSWSTYYWYLIPTSWDVSHGEWNVKEGQVCPWHVPVPSKTPRHSRSWLF